jgi:hypothetical protein
MIAGTPQIGAKIVAKPFLKNGFGELELLHGNLFRFGNKGDLSLGHGEFSVTQREIVAPLKRTYCVRSD